MKLEKYGIKMQGLKKAAGETKHLNYWNGYTHASPATLQGAGAHG